MAARIAPKTQEMNGSFNLLSGEQQMYTFESFDMAGKPVTGVVTDRRLILRATNGLCDFPMTTFNMCLCAEVDSSYAIVDLKNVKPYVAQGSAANCLQSMFDLRTKYPYFCCCLPKLLPHGINLGFSRPPGDYVPFWSFWPMWSVGTGTSYQSVRLQLRQNDAIELRKLLAGHPQAKGLKYTHVNKD